MQVDGYSLDAQRDKLRKYAAYEDMAVAGEYSDEGFSGKNIQGRQEFQRMLNDIQDCKDGVSYVLVFFCFSVASLAFSNPRSACATCPVIASKRCCSACTLNWVTVRCSSVLPRSPRSTSV